MKFTEPYSYVFIFKASASNCTMACMFLVELIEGTELGPAEAVPTDVHDPNSVKV